jgi:hypothetical protein
MKWLEPQEGRQTMFLDHPDYRLIHARQIREPRDVLIPSEPPRRRRIRDRFSPAR